MHICILAYFDRIAHLAAAKSKCMYYIYTPFDSILLLCIYIRFGQSQALQYLILGLVFMLFLRLYVIIWIYLLLKSVILT
jgi:hypothetical protein